MMLNTKYARYGDASIAYQTVGQGEVDLIFVPCWISHLERLWKEPRFVRFVERLSTFGRVILFDKRGTGLSDPAPATKFPTLDERMEDLLAVLDEAGSRRAVLVGSAIGGQLAALFAAAHPERVAALVTFGSSARGTWAPDYPWAPTPEEHERRFAQLLEAWGGPVMVEAYASSLADDPAFCKWWAECLRSGASPTTAVAAERLSAESDARAVLPKIQAPTLVLHRTGDRLVKIEAGRYLAEHVPNAQFVELSGSDHLIFVGDQDELFESLGQFLAETVNVKSPSPLERRIATVAVLDVPGVAETAVRMGERRWAEVSASYRQLLRRELTRNRGQESVVSQDGALATFDGPARAVEFAKSIATGLSHLGLRSRIGLHTGEIEIGEREIGGKAVHMATRIAAHACSGEVIVSETVVGLVAGSGLSFEPIDEQTPVALPVDCRLFRVDTRAQALAPLMTLISAGRSQATPAPILPLSPRERQVVELLARGLSNREISDELAISVATAERHVSNIMTKLGVRSRTQIVAWAAGMGRGWEMPAEQVLARSLAPHRLATLAAD